MDNAVLTACHLKKYYPILVNGKGIHREKKLLKAVDDVSLAIRHGEALGIVGESGCGKSTLAKALLKLLPLTDGKLFYGDTDVTALSRKQMRPLRRRVQIIFQNPYSSLNPRKTVRLLVRAPLDAMNLGSARTREEKVCQTLELVGLSTAFLEKYPHEMSGGQRQRVAIARALVSDPEMVVCDEPTSALDVSARGQILNVLKRLQHQQGVSYLYISHDFGTVRYLCNRVSVMYLGRIVEEGAKEDIFERPAHPYTRALLSAEPVPRLGFSRERVILRGDVVNPVYPPSGCPFRSRCVYATESCSKGEYRLQPLKRVDGGTHSSACPRYHKLSVRPDMHPDRLLAGGSSYVTLEPKL